ncbi:MAG: lipid-A-disaccharide synthase [Burkholderiales bacterium]|nr:lipid-A-disaccharide synthase [Burkholderiales bacterium]MDG2202981.1 lipid-A-disaccharide synthase [Burkholderiales bacterium]
MASSRKLRVVIVVGEASGDTLGAAVLQELEHRYSQVEAVGIGGPLMLSSGFDSWYAMSELSVMGYVEVFRKLPRLLRLRSSLIKKITEYKPDLLIGVDAPDFNLYLERRVRNAGIPVMHLVSPSIWAWRYERIHKIRESVDRMLVLFPFEVEIYQRECIPVSYVGHPLADDIELRVDRLKYRKQFGYHPDKKVVALLLGSRKSELNQHLSLMIDSVNILSDNVPDLQFVAPLLDRQSIAFVEKKLLNLYGSVKVNVEFRAGDTRNILKAADVAIIASGTATLEALLCECPMVVTYRVPKLTAWLMRRKANTEYVSLPNIIAGTSLVGEYIQENAKAYLLAKEVTSLLKETQRSEVMKGRFVKIKEALRVGSAKRVVDEIQNYLSGS